MAGVAFLFQLHCERLVKNLSHEQYNNFKNAPNDMERIRLLYSHAVKVPIPDHPSGKCYKDALDFKAFGNELYKVKKLKQALKEYNKGIAACPVGDDSSQALLAVLIANRSAVLYELDLMTECLRDIDWVVESGWYPENLRYKILWRKAKCSKELRQFTDSISSIDAAIRATANANLPVQKKQELQDFLLLVEGLGSMYDDVEVRSDAVTYIPFERNPVYPAAAVAVRFQNDPVLGRYAVATRDIQAATIILEEEPFCVAVSKENNMRNCAHCSLSTISPYPCENCGTVVFCSMKCKREATYYHTVECDILRTIYSSGASVNCLMSLRIITQHGFDYFWSHKKQFDLKTHKDVYESKDYYRIYNLCTHSDTRSKGEFLHYTFMAIFLLRLLKRTSYFPFVTTDEVLTEEESYIGSLMLRHLQLLQFNAHELSEMRNCELGDIPYMNAHVGGAIYPTLAMFNHSCEPSIVRYNKGKRIIVRAIKYIKAGEIIYENYGPIYCSQEIGLRQKKLQERYYFKCACVPCSENWPLYESMDTDSLRLKCEFCDRVMIVGKSQEYPYFNCKNCKEKNNVMITSMKLMKVEEFTTRAEESFKSGDYKDAIQFYQVAMEFYYKYMAAPFQDMVKVQQRLRTCMLHDGNLEKLYKMPTDFLPITSPTYPIV